MSDGKGLHLETEVALSEDDIFRFCHYHLDLIRAYKFDFTTVIFVKDKHKQTGLDYGMLKFSPIIINCSDYDADQILTKLKEQAEKGEPLNELELIYLPLFKSIKYKPVELLTESIRLINTAKIDDNQKLKISALAIVLSNKLVDADKLEQLWEELKMMRIKVLEYGINKSFQEGKQEGKQEVALKMLQRGKLLAEIVEDTALEEEQIIELASQHGLEVKK